MKKRLHNYAFFRHVVFIILSLCVPACALFAQTTQTFTTSGSWICPYGVTSVTVETWGGGGAGGGATNKAGGGGGGGAYTTSSVSVTYGTSYNYVVGAGGIGASAANGPAGGATSFNGTVTANGGAGGIVGTTTDGAGGAGAAGTYNGGNGATAVTNSGGGGGGAGSSAAGGNGGVTAAGTAGATGGGAGGAGRSSNGDGNAGVICGGGGGGGKNSGAAKLGGDGARGQVKITYTINCTAPPAQATSLILTPASSTSIGGAFTASAYTDGYLTVRTTSATPPSNPVNGTTYVAGNSALGGVIVQSSAALSFTASSLTAGVQYWFWVYSFNNSPCVGGITYLTSSPLSDNSYTACVAPTASPTSLVLTPSSYSMAVSWTASATAEGYIVVRTPTTTVGTPTNGTVYTVGQSALSGTIEYVGTGTSYTSTGLSANTNYYYSVYGYKNVNCSVIAYRTTVLKTNATTLLAPCAAPSAQPTALVLTPAASSIGGAFTAEPSAYGYLVVRTLTASAPTNPADGTTYTAGQSVLGGLIIYAGTATTFNSATLSNNTQYWYWVYSYNDITCSGGIKYFTTSPLTGSGFTLCTTPAGQPSTLVLTPTATTIAASFTATTADGYLVIRMTSNATVTLPTNGTVYTVGTNALGGYVDMAGAGTTFTSTGLSSTTQYWYTIFAYNFTTCSTVAYKTSSPNPLKGNTTTLTPVCTAPAAQPTSLTFSPVYSESLSASFTATTADGYLAIRTATSTPPSSPVDATTYTVGASALGGTVVYVGAATSWTSGSVLTANTTYWYWIYAYNNTGCSGGPVYRTTSPLTANVTTAAVGTWTNTCTITTPGDATYPWSTLSWGLGHVPTSSEHTQLILNNAGTAHDAIIVNLDQNISVYSFTMTNQSPSTIYRHIFSTNGAVKFYVTTDVTITAPGGFRFNRAVFANTDSTVINGNLTLGRLNPGATDGHGSIGSTGSTPNQYYTLYGDMIFNPRGYTTDEWAKFIFNKAGTQYIVNNTVTTDTTQPVLFEHLIIGPTNATTVILSGTAYDAYIENVRAAGVTIGANSVLDLPNGYSLTKFSGGFAEPFTLGAGATLRLGGDKTMDRNNVVNGITGSNFPSNFSPYTLNATSTVEYYGSSGITQTIYSGATYGNLLIKNGPATGRAAKTNSGAVTAVTSINVNALADWNLGNTVSSTGPFNVNSTGGLYCATNTVSGAGAFTLASGGYLGMGSPQGITSGTTASGNVQMMGGRSFSTGGNYIYNGSVTQVTGNGLPTTCNDLFADNPTTVTIANSQIVTGINKLAQGTFDIGSTKMKITGNGTLTSTGGKMKANAGQLELNGSSGTAQSLAGSWFVNKNISTLINSNTTGITVAATANDSLLIASALLYGTGTTNSVITTNNNVTLLSRDTATARFGEIVTGSGNTITGNVTVERYVSTSRKWRLLSWPTTSTQTARQSWMENNVTANGNISPGYGTIVTDEQTTWSTNNFDSRSVSGPSVKYYNQASATFTGIPNTTVYQMNSQPAYYNFVRGDRSCLPSNGLTSSTILRTTGTLKTGNQVQNISANNFGAVGNPYASAIDLRLLDTVNLITTFYVWDPNLAGTWGLGAYQNIYKSGSDYKIMPGGGSYTALNSIMDTLESGQGFFVKAKATAATLTFKENAKADGVRTQSRETTTVEAAIYPLLYKKFPTYVSLADGAMGMFDNAYSASVDYDDAPKMVNTSENVSLKRENQLLAIERRPMITQNDTLFINLSGLQVHQYEWEITSDALDGTGRTAVLSDNFLGIETPLSLTAPTQVVFDVTAAVGSGAANRFMIIFRQAAVVPVRFTAISAVRNADKTVTVKWHAENEINMQDYKIEYSATGNNFTTIGSQAATANNGNSASYAYVDGHATTGNNYYRIRGNSLNGQVQYTAVVKVGPLKTEAGMSIYPNPVTDQTINLHFEDQPTGKYDVLITNSAGQRVQGESVSVQTGNTVRMILLPNDTAGGSYQATVTDSSGKQKTIPFMVK